LIFILKIFVKKKIVTLLTIFALFGDDIRVMATNKSADTGFDVMTIICLVIFSLEIFMSILCKKDYLFSFFFWLDLVSTVSLILDI
jgi:hypothetical protein